MQILIWAITGVLLLMWTGLIAVAAAVVNWVVGMSLDPALRGAKAIGNAPVPEWVSIWMPPAVLESLKTSAGGILEAALAGLGWLSPMLGWISPLLWVVWALVVVIALVLALVLHLLVRRNRRQGGGSSLQPGRF